MTSYVGIDLGTTNSAICSYDGEEIHLYKSPEQNEVTPSAISIDRRGNRYVGQRAYDNAPRNPDGTALLFKRLMGTATPIHLQAVGITMTPEECSATLLQTLFGYLPEVIRNDDAIGTVITVPAAFNQMQKDATMEAARNAGLGKVALMQEPVAAVMSVMRRQQRDGMFLIYDLGGGTLDIAIAESTGGRVSLLGQGGIAMCGGRDFDRAIVDRLVIGWLTEKFDLPAGFAALPEYRLLMRTADRAVEKAKIELSVRDVSVVSATESECACRDISGEEIYLDVNVTRDQLGALIEDRIRQSVTAARETIAQAGLTPADIDRIVFVGGPTQYKPLRDRVADELGITASTDIDPMTAVAAGAAIFAESIDWSTENRARKTGRGSANITDTLDLTINYASRTPDWSAKIALKAGTTDITGYSFQIDSLDNGWSSGRSVIRSDAIIEVPLTQPAENFFKLFVFDPSGGPVPLIKDRIVITRTAATIDAIPASHSIGIEVLDGDDSVPVLDYLVRVGDLLPARGTHLYRSAESLRAGTAGTIKFKVWEGDIADAVSDNLFVGLLEIAGSDFDTGVIPAGAELILNYEIGDAGNVDLQVEVPSIGGSFQSGKNFYSRRSGMIDYSRAARRMREDAERTAERLAAVAAKVTDPALAETQQLIDRVRAIKSSETDPETAKQAMDDIQKAKRILATVRRANLKTVRRADLDRVLRWFEAGVRQSARPYEVSAFEDLHAATERLIGHPGRGFESNVKEMTDRVFTVLYRQDWHIIHRFRFYARSPHLFDEPKTFERLVAEGEKALADDDIDALRQTIHRMDGQRIRSSVEDDLVADSNIVRG